MSAQAKPTALDRALTWISRAAPTRVVAASGLCLLLLTAGSLVVCRLAGTLTRPMPAFGYLACLIIAGVVCCGMKFTAEWPPYQLDRRNALGFGVLLCLPFAALAISLPTTWTPGSAGITTLWCALVSWFSCSTQSAPLVRQFVGGAVWPEIERFLFPTQATTESAEVESVPAIPVEVRVHETAADDNVVSELQRRTTLDGEVLEGQLIATFAAGSRQTVVHIPFTPPFAAMPEIECEVSDGTDVRIKVGAVFCYGARLELKRSGSDLAEQQVHLDIYAAAASPVSDAA